jgi:hypothetical protein
LVVWPETSGTRSKAISRGEGEIFGMTKDEKKRLNNRSRDFWGIDAVRQKSGQNKLLAKFNLENSNFLITNFKNQKLN